MTDKTPTSNPTATAVATTPLENEAPPDDYNESNTTNIYLNYRITNNALGTTTTSSNKSQPVARSAASASNRSNDPAIDTANGYDDDNNDNTDPAIDTANGYDDDNNDNTDQVSESFQKDLKKQGLEIVEQEGDGNCLFRAVNLQVYGDSSMHEDVRQQCLDLMARDVEHFRQFVVGEDFGAYIARKRQDGVHGNHTEIQAVSELFN
jgi:OTU domain-containing protein 5